MTCKTCHGIWQEQFSLLLSRPHCLLVKSERYLESSSSLPSSTSLPLPSSVLLPGGERRSPAARTICGCPCKLCATSGRGSLFRVLTRASDGSSHAIASNVRRSSLAISITPQSLCGISHSYGKWTKHVPEPSHLAGAPRRKSDALTRFRHPEHHRLVVACLLPIDTRQAPSSQEQDNSCRSQWNPQVPLRRHIDVASPPETDTTW